MKTRFYLPIITGLAIAAIAQASVSAQSISEENLGIQPLPEPVYGIQPLPVPVVETTAPENNDPAQNSGLVETPGYQSQQNYYQAPKQAPVQRYTAPAPAVAPAPAAPAPAPAPAAQPAPAVVPLVSINGQTLIGVQK